MALVHNVARLKPRRRELRRRLTIAEARLWNHLKESSLRGRKFRRQHSVGPYILDFYCPGERLAVELDGADRKSTRLNSSHSQISYAVFCLKKKKLLSEDTHIRIFPCMLV